jgi:hypothetical protein
VNLPQFDVSKGIAVRSTRAVAQMMLATIKAVLLYPKIKKRHGRSRKEKEEFLNKASQASILA